MWLFTTQVWSHKLTRDEIAEHFPSGLFFGKWGGLGDKVVAGDELLMPYPMGGEVYSIKAALFDKTYVLEDPQNRVPTHEELLAEWTTVFQNKEGGLHRKSEVVFIKAAGEHNDPVPTTVDDPTVIELTVEAHCRPIAI